MKNPLKKETHTGVITGMIIGGVVAAGIAYLFFTDDGEKILDGWKHQMKETAKDIGSGVVSKKTGISKKKVKKAADIVVK